MNQIPENDPNEPDLFESRLRYVGPIFFVLWGGFAFVIAMLGHGGAADYFAARLDQKMAYVIKEWWSPSGHQPDNLKILAVDDQTVAYNQNRPDISLPTWAKLLTNIARMKPRVILIDRVFAGNPYPSQGSAAEHHEITQSLAAIKAIETPIVVGADIVNHMIPMRKTIPLSNQAHSFAHYLTKAKEATDPLRELPSINTQFRTGSVYGFAPEFQGVFHGVGHVIYDNHALIAVSPFYLLGQDRVVPHISLYASGKTEIRDQALFVNDYKVPLDHRGWSFVSHKPPSFFKPKSLVGPIMRALAGEPEKLVKQGDTVFIIPGFYTGAADFHEGGPFGEIPGGYIIGEMLNSVLTGDWLRVIGRFDKLHHGIVLAMLLAGAALGFGAGPVRAFFMASFLGLSYLFGGLAYFVYGRTLLPISLPLVGFTGSVLILYGHTIVQGELKKLKLRRDFFREKALRIQEESERKLLQERLALGKAVQEMLLPQNLEGQISDFSYKMRYKPSQQMSGDWLYYWQVSPDERRIFIGDVVGKGPSAALPVAIIITTLKEAESAGLPMAQTIERVNNRLLDHFGGKVTSTLAAVAMFSDHRLCFYNAGSPGWFVVGLGSDTNYINLRSNPLGISYGSRVASTDLILDTTKLIFTFTDGYMEGARAYRRLVGAIKTHSFNTMTHDLIHDCLIKTGEGFRLEDDMTMVSIKVA